MKQAECVYKIRFNELIYPFSLLFGKPMLAFIRFRISEVFGRVSYVQVTAENNGLF